MNDDFLVATELSKGFGGRMAVNGLSFAIHRQEIFGLLGPNGAGKATTIRMLSTVLKPDGGDIAIGGHQLSEGAGKIRKLIGVCPQELALYEELSARDNLVFFGRMAGMSGKDANAKADENLEMVGLSGRAKDAVSKFSGGMKRRVNLAIGLMNSPALLFLDEPTVGIDPQSRNNTFDTVLALRDAGMTALYTTHYMEEADRLCDRVAIMDAGQLTGLGVGALRLRGDSWLWASCLMGRTEALCGGRGLHTCAAGCSRRYARQAREI